MLLTGNSVHLWLGVPAELDELPPSDGLQSLSRDERERGERFSRHSERVRFLSTRLLVRHVLSRYAPIAPAEWRLVSEQHGKPAIAPLRVACELRFNVSHSEDLIVLAIAAGREIGVDVERPRHRPNLQAIAERCFTIEERESLRRLPERDRLQRFAEVWTLKEAYAKALGLGLGIALNSFSFDLENGSIMSALPADRQGSWSFSQFSDPNGHMIALCVQNNSTQPLKVIARLVSPARVGDPTQVGFVRADPRGVRLHGAATEDWG